MVSLKMTMSGLSQTCLTEAACLPSDFVVKESRLEGSEAENSMADDSESRCSSFDLRVGVFLSF